MIHRDPKELRGDCRAMVALLLANCARRGLPVWIFEAVRTPERQARLYAQGRTAPGKVVTWTLKSRHIDRDAADMVWRNRGGWSWDEPWKGAWQELGALGEECGLEWGGRWRRPDYPHFQMRG